MFPYGQHIRCISMVVVGLVESYVIFCVYHIVTCVDVVPFKDLLKYFWLVDFTLLHEIDCLILDHDCVIHVVIKLYLYFILQLSSLRKELFLIDILYKLGVVLGEQVELSDSSP